MVALKGAKGFTLMELLVVVAIVGILAAIAIPQFSAYRQRGFDARAISDMGNAATAEEAYYSTYSRYLQCQDSDCNHPTLPGFQISADTRLITIADFFGDDQFILITWSNRGSGRFFVWLSEEGGFQG